MEYVEGVTLRECIAERRMNVSEALDAAIQIASALSAAHAAGLCTATSNGEHHAPA